MFLVLKSECFEWRWFRRVLRRFRSKWTKPHTYANRRTFDFQSTIVGRYLFWRRWRVGWRWRPRRTPRSCPTPGTCPTTGSSARRTRRATEWSSRRRRTRKATDAVPTVTWTPTASGVQSPTRPARTVSRPPAITCRSPRLRSPCPSSRHPSPSGELKNCFFFENYTFFSQIIGLKTKIIPSQC